MVSPIVFPSGPCARSLQVSVGFNGKSVQESRFPGTQRFCLCPPHRGAGTRGRGGNVPSRICLESLAVSCDIRSSSGILRSSECSKKGSHGILGAEVEETRKYNLKCDTDFPA